MQQPTVEVATICMNDGKVLIGKNPNGKWKVPGDAVRMFENCQSAAKRAFEELTGVIIDAKHILFVTEMIGADTHRIIIYAYGEYVSGDAKEKTPVLSDIQWVDVRELGEFQQDMSDETVDAFFKFSLVLRQQAGRQSPTGTAHA
jgi:ADP-ribose pyrophosphatase YjhB (NUDIX family)